jgi:hypothetical protein
MFTDEYWSMKEIAKTCGSTQKRVGLALEKLDLWIVGRSPTQKAYREGYIAFREYPNKENYPLPVWHREKTLKALATLDIVPLPVVTSSPATRKDTP